MCRRADLSRSSNRPCRTRSHGHGTSPRTRLRSHRASPFPIILMNAHSTPGQTFARLRALRRAKLDGERARGPHCQHQVCALYWAQRATSRLRLQVSFPLDTKCRSAPHKAERPFLPATRPFASGTLCAAPPLVYSTATRAESGTWTQRCAATAY